MAKKTPAPPRPAPSNPVNVGLARMVKSPPPPPKSTPPPTDKK